MSKTTVMKPITVSESTRKQYWSKFQNYAVSSCYLKRKNLVFQAYKQKGSFDEIPGKTYVIPTKDAKALFKDPTYRKSSYYHLISVNDVKNLAKNSK